MKVIKRYLSIFIVVLGLLPGAVSLAQEKDQSKTENDQDMVMEEVVITEKKIITPTKQTNETVYTGSEITKKGMETQGVKATTSVYEAVDILPGIVAESSDPYGLAAEQNQIRTRGVRGYLGSMTVEGVPNWGGNPIGPRDYLYDMENMESIAVYKGAVPSDLGISVGARGGAIELRPRWPELELGADFGHALGERNYSRTFFRVDSGAFPGVNTALSASYSYSHADKWKGPGEVGPRNNFNFMLSQPVGDKDVIKLWYNYNELEQDLYRTLSYVEVDDDLHGNYNKDFNDNLTGNKASDIYYYKYNRGKYKNQDALAVIPIPLSKSVGLSFKPYYSMEDTEILQGVGSMGGTIQERIRDVERYGFISELDWELPWMTASVGYWYESVDMVINNRFYDPVSYEFKGYGMYTKSGDNGVISSPYIRLAGSKDKFDWQFGLKYFQFTDPESQGYTSAAPDYELVKADDLLRKEKTYDAYLPTLGVSYHMSDSASIYAVYGRSHIRPYSYMPIINLYSQNRVTFQNAGITLQDLFDGYDMEISDSYEVGGRFINDRLELSSSVFYSKHDNLITTVYDPRVDLSYSQFVGEATGYGVELGANIFIGDYLTVFVNPTYTRLTNDKDLTYQGATLDTKDKQVPDTPEWTIKTGVIANYEGFNIVPRVRYIGKSYADAENEEKISEHTVADLKLGYTKKNVWIFDSVTMSVETNNLFDEEYISKINASDDSRAGVASFNVGAPRTTVFAMTMEF